MKNFIGKALRYITLLAVFAAMAAFVYLYASEYFFTSNNGTKSIAISDSGIITDANVSYKLKGMIGSVTLTKSSGGINDAAGALSSGINIKAHGKKVESAHIEFKYNSENNDFNPEKLGIAYFNEELGRMELLESEIDKEKSSISVDTSHFSEYVVVDTDEWYDAWIQSQVIIRDSNAKTYFDVAFAIDRSSSMYGEKNELSKQSTYEFITNLYDEDAYSLIAFNSKAETIIPPQTFGNANSEILKSTVDSIEATGGTEINEALSMGVNVLASDGYGDKTKLLVLLSDGQSQVNDAYLEEAKRQNINVITVGFGSDTNEGLLQNIAAATDGRYYKAEENNISDIFELIREEYLGVDLSADTDGDKIPDKVERIGMRNQYGKIIVTDPEKADTDGDGKTDGEEMGTLVVDENVSEQDRAKGITRYVYFRMVSHPLIKDGNIKIEKPKLKVILNDKELSFDETPIVVNSSILTDVSIFENIGAEVVKSESENTVTITKGKRSIKVVPGTWWVNLNDSKKECYCYGPIYEQNGHIMVPVEITMQLMGGAVTWLKDSKTVNIYYSDIIDYVLENDYDRKNAGLNINVTGFDAKNIFSDYNYNYKYMDKYYNDQLINAAIIALDNPTMPITTFARSFTDFTNADYVRTHKSLNINDFYTKELVAECLATAIESVAGDKVDLSGADAKLRGDVKKVLSNVKTVNKLIINEDSSLKGLSALNQTVKGASDALESIDKVTEILEYAFTDYGTSLSYLNAVRDALQKNGLLDSSLEMAINSLETEYNAWVVTKISDYFTGKVSDEITGLISSAVGGGAYSFVSFVWNGMNIVSGNHTRASELKKANAYMLYNLPLSRCYRMYAQKIYDGDYTADDVLLCEKLFEICKASRIQEYKCAINLDMADRNPLYPNIPIRTDELHNSEYSVLENGMNMLQNKTYKK